MTDIINLNDFRKTKEAKDPLKTLEGLSANIVMESIKRLYVEGYDIQDPDFLLDMETILSLLSATLCRQCDIKHKYIKELDRLNGRTSK